MHKKKIVMSVIILVFAYIFTACTKINALKELVEDRKKIEIVGIDGKENDTVNFQEHEVPNGFTDGYEFGDHEKYNSPAKENGYGGDKIWVSGIIKEVNVLKSDDMDIYFCVLYTEDGEGWLIHLDYEEADKKKYDEMIGHSVIAVGIYEGFSEVYKYPALTMNRIWDSTDGSIVTSVLWGDYEGDDWHESHDEWREESYKKVSFQIPTDWGYANYSDSGEYVYYYPDGGMMILFFQKGSGFVFDNNDDTASFLDGYIGAVEDAYTNFHEESRTIKTLENGQRSAVIDWWGYHNDVGMNVYTRAYLIVIDGDILNISYNNYFEKNEDNLDIFDEIVNSIN